MSFWSLWCAASHPPRHHQNGVSFAIRQSAQLTSLANCWWNIREEPRAPTCWDTKGVYQKDTSWAHFNLKETQTKTVELLYVGLFVSSITGERPARRNGTSSCVFKRNKKVEARTLPLSEGQLDFFKSKLGLWSSPFAGILFHDYFVPET